jgi:hypothetical protein
MKGGVDDVDVRNFYLSLLLDLDQETGVVSGTIW